MSSKDYYQVMGLAKDASPKDIKSAYRRLARKYHPDLNKGPNAEAQFKELGEAYEVLKDPAKRRAYDQQGRETHAEHQQRHRPAAGDYAFYTGAEGGVEDDLFASLFGGRGRRASHAPMPGADVQATLHVSLEEAYHGVVKSIRMPSAGSEGTQLKVNIPAGIKSGQPIRLAGQGEASPLGGPKGDLYLTIVVDKHPLFDVMGDDIYLTLPIAPWEAALGITIKVPTLAGPVGLKIPPGSQGGQTLRLKARGLRGKTHGDQYVLLKIMIPTPKTDADKAFYQQMAKDMPFDPRERWGGLNG